MLRPPSTRIDLTLDDIDGYEARFAARRGRIRQDCNTSIRLNLGPERQTSQAIASKHQQTDPHGARPPVDLPRDEFVGSMNRVVRFVDDEGVPVDAMIAPSIEHERHHQSSTMQPLRWDCEDVPPSRLSSQSNTSEIAATSPGRDILESRWSHYDDTDISEFEESLNTSTSPGPKPAPLREIISDAFPTGRPLRSSPRPFSSARARRHDIFHDPAHQQDYIESRHRERIPLYQPSSQLPCIPQPVPRLVPSLLAGGDASLDPGAPVFVPRTRFASSVTYHTSGITYERPLQWGSMDSTHSSTNLRVRPSSEQNVDSGFRGHANAGNVLSMPQHRRHRVRSRTHDQHDGAPHRTANIDRYPVLGTTTRMPSGEELHDPGSIAEAVLAPYEVLPGTSPSLDIDQTQVHVRHVTSIDCTRPIFSQAATTNDQFDISSMVRSSMTPDIAQATFVDTSSPPRSHPETWHSDEQRHEPPSPPAYPSEPMRVPNVENGTNDLCCGDQMQSVAQMSSYARNRSPLEQLAENFSRLAASLERPRSVGRSLEPRHRTSLLHGNPFAVDSRLSSPSTSPSAIESGPPIYARNTEPAASEPPSTPSFAPSTSPPLPSSPGFTMNASRSSTPIPELSSPYVRRTAFGPALGTANHLNDHTTVSRDVHRPMPSTPRVRVYNDTAPPHAQPQTPADLPHAHARTRPQSRPVASAVLSSEQRLSSPARFRTQDHPNAHLFSSSPPLTTPRSPLQRTVPATAPHIPTLRRRTRTHDTENELDGLEAHLPELRRERRAWLGRRTSDGEQHTQGSLEVTPPALGRFERITSDG